MSKKKSDPKVHYPEIPEDFVFPDDLDKVEKAIVDQAAVFIPRNQPVLDKYGRILANKKEIKRPSQEIKEYIQKQFEQFPIIPEADWIKAIRNYCRENSIAPTTLITAYEELKQQENDNRADSSASY